MNDLFHNFHFLRPWLLVFLLLPMLLFFKKLKTGEMLRRGQMFVIKIC